MVIKLIAIIFCLFSICVLQSSCQQFELIYAKPSDVMQFFTSKGSRNIALVNRSRVMLIESENGNIIFTETVGNISRTDFMTIDDSNHRLFCGYIKEGFRVDIYDTKNWLLRKRFSLKTDTILISDISPDNRYTIVIDNHYNARIYDLESDTLVYDFQREIDEYFLIYYAKFSNDGKRIALLGGTKIYFFNFENKSIEKEINSINYHVHRVIFSNSNSYLLKFNYGTSVEVFDILTGEKVKIFEHYGKPVYVTQTNNDSLLISRVGDKVYFWDFFKNVVFDSLIALQCAILEFDNNKYLVGGIDSISLWNIETRLLHKQIARQYSWCKFVAGGSYFVSGAILLTSSIHFTINGEKAKDIKIYGESYFPDATLYYYYLNDTIFINDIFDETIHNAYYYPIDAFGGYLRFSDDLKYLYYLDTNQTLYVYDWHNQTILYKLDSLISFTYKGLSGEYLLFSKNSRYVAGLKKSFLSGKWSLFLANGSDGNILFEYLIPSNTASGFTFSYDEKYFFFRVGDNPVNQLDIERREIVKIYNELDIQGRTTPFRICSFPDRPWLAVASKKDPIITIIDYDNDNIVTKLLGDIQNSTAPDSLSISVDISRCGNYLLVESYGDMIMLWKNPMYSDVEDGTRLTIKMKPFITQNSTEIQVNINLDKAEQINFQVFDLFGRMVQSVTKTVYLSGSFSETLDLSFLSSGCYILVAQVGMEFDTFQFSIVK